MVQHNQNECRHHGHEKRAMDRRGHAGRGDTGTGDDRALSLFRRTKVCDFDASAGQHEIWCRWAWLPVRLYGYTECGSWREAKNAWVWWTWVYEIRTLDGFVPYWWVQR